MFDEKLQRAEAAAAGLHAVGAGFFAGIVQDRADAQRLEKAAAFDIGGKAFDRDAGLDLADIAFVKNELVEGDGLRRGEREFLGRLWSSEEAPGLEVPGQPETLSRPFPFTPPLQTSSSKRLGQGRPVTPIRALSAPPRA